MVTYFNRKDLVSFGNYLLSDKRKQRVISSRDEAIRQGLNAIPIEDYLSEVSHADVENWKESLKSTESFEVPKPKIELVKGERVYMKGYSGRGEVIDVKPLGNGIIGYTANMYNKGIPVPNIEIFYSNMVDVVLKHDKFMELSPEGREKFLSK